MDQHKKIEERQWLDLLRSCYSAFPSGRIMASEAPDFILMPNRKVRIGIEITRFFPESYHGVAKESSITDPLQMNDLVQIVAAKEEKILAYRKQLLQHIWLLVVIDPKYFRMPLRFNNEYLRRGLRSKFDRVFILVLPDKLWIHPEN